jgi:hypothetical protein
VTGRGDSHFDLGGDTRGLFGGTFKIKMSAPDELFGLENLSKLFIVLFNRKTPQFLEKLKI